MAWNGTHLEHIFIIATQPSWLKKIERNAKIVNRGVKKKEQRQPSAF